MIHGGDMPGGQQWNPVDGVTHMPDVIRRLWLLHLCEL